jgi:hypothetical protein
MTWHELHNHHKSAIQWRRVRGINREQALFVTYSMLLPAANEEAASSITHLSTGQTLHI